MIATTTREKPIIFSAPMFCAIEDGRKTQTRRIVTERDFAPGRGCSKKSFNTVGSIAQKNGEWRCYLAKFPGVSAGTVRPRYRVGDVLWVKTAAWYDPVSIAALKGVLRCFYDDGTVVFSDGRKVGKPIAPVTVARLWAAGLKRRPSIHMPRWASRRRIRVTDVGIEPVQSISEADAIAEGMVRGLNYGKSGICRTAKEAFAALWNSIHGPGAWERNDWVWRNSFERIA